MQNLGLTSVSFRITSIKNGWLFAELELSDYKLEIANSSLGGLELPKALVRMCNSFLLADSFSQWLCWHGEFHAQIWHIQTDNSQLCITSYNLASSFGLPVYGDCLANKVYGLEPHISAHVDTVTFTYSIYQAFKEYRFGDMLQQWQGTEFKDHFPEAEYQTLRRLLRKKGYH